MGECYINRLPIELLAAILEEHSVLELRAPFIDSQVCGRWHATTRLWPRVWSYITMRSKTEHRIPFNQFRAILERSAATPLHVDLEYPDDGVGISSMMLFQRATITRIQTLLLKGRLPGDIRVMKGMPNLRILQLMGCYWGGAIKFLLGAETFPRLVVHSMGLLPPVAVGSPVPLRTISFYDINHTEWVNILLECRETLVEVFLCRCQLPLPPPTRIHLPNLKFLALSNMINFQNSTLNFRNNMLNFRNAIVAPGIITFHEYFKRLAPLKVPFALSSITEYACRATSPFVGSEPLLAEGVFPNLERVVLWGTWLRIRQVLWELVSHPHTLPKLKTIELATENGRELSGTRWAELEKLVVHTPLSSVLKRPTDPRASYACLRLAQVRGWLLIAQYSYTTVRHVGVSPKPEQYHVHFGNYINRMNE